MVGDIKKVFEEYNPGFVFEHGFLDQEYDELYGYEERISKIMRSFTLFAIFISCLGLFGLAAFSAQKKTKEIGIRKALGASISSLIILVSKQFMKLVLISFVFAWPLAYYLMKNWLNNYAFKIELNIWIFIISGIILIIITFLTILYQSINASRTNPVDSLKYE